MASLIALKTSVTVITLASILKIAMAAAPAPSQVSVLQQLMAAWGPFKNSATWKPGSDCSLWSGLQCDSSGIVTTLYLPNSNLVGAIPAAISSLKGLKILILMGNSLTGAIPTSIGGLSSLNVLKLNRNKLMGTIPDFFAGLPALTDLYLGENQFYGTLPPSLSRLASLTAIDVGGNFLTGSIPAFPLATRFYFYNVSYNYFYGSPRIFIGGRELCAVVDFSFAMPVLQANCLTFPPTQYNCVREGQWPAPNCAAFCNTNVGAGQCNGRGVCIKTSTASSPTCSCNSGAKPPPSSPFLCSSAPFSSVFGS